MRRTALHLLGLAYAGGIGLALWYFWPDAQRAVRGVAGREVQHVLVLVYVFAALWVAEKVWEALIPRLGGERTTH